jgi:hypothetical protein
MPETCSFIVEGEGRRATFCDQPATHGSYCACHHAATHQDPAEAAEWEKAYLAKRALKAPVWTGREWRDNPHHSKSFSLKGLRI